MPACGAGSWTTTLGGTVADPVVIFLSVQIVYYMTLQMLTIYLYDIAQIILDCKIFYLAINSRMHKVIKSTDAHL